MTEKKGITIINGTIELNFKFWKIFTAPMLTILSKWWIYTWTKTRNKRVKILRHKFVNVFGKGTSVVTGNTLNIFEKKIAIMDEKPRKKSHRKMERNFWAFWLPLIIYLAFSPIHKIFYVFWGWQWRWFFEILSISPKILISLASSHFWTRCLITIFRHSSID